MVGLYTHTHLRFVVGLNKVHEKCLKLWLVYASNKALEGDKYFLFMLLMFMPFAWGQTKIQGWGSLMRQ